MYICGAVPDGEWFEWIEWIEWFWVVGMRIKVFEKFFDTKYNSLKPLKPLQPLTTIGDCLCWQWGFAMEWFLGLCKTFLCTAINFTLQIGIASHDSYGQTN